jgi:hypothetical protein
MLTGKVERDRADSLPLFHDRELNQNKFIHQSANHVQAYKVFKGLEKKCKLETVYCELLLSL